MALRATILTEVHVGKIGSASPIRELREGYNVFFIVIPTDSLNTSKSILDRKIKMIFEHKNDFTNI